MTLVNPAEKVTAAPLIGRPATQEEIQAIQRFETRMTARMQAQCDAISSSLDENARMIRETSNIVRDTIQKVDMLLEDVTEARDSIRDSQPVEAPNCFQKIGEFFVRAFRYIGLVR